MTVREKQNLERAIRHIEERREEDYRNPDTLISILKYSELKLVKRERSNGKEWDTSLDEANLYVNALFYNEAEDNIDCINLALEKSYRIDDNAYSLGRNINLKMGEIEPIDGLAEIDVSFRGIKEKVIEGIRGAKYVIFSAVAWITDKEIVDELIKKSNEGIEVRVVMSISETGYSRKAEKKLRDSLVKCKTIEKFGYYDNNIMHNKFCVIDLSYVINGSYNWTSMANFHKENIIIAKNYSLASVYADEFIRLFASGR